MTGAIKETMHIGSIQLNFLLDGEDTNDTTVVFEFIVGPKAKVPAPHFHVAVDEVPVLCTPRHRTWVYQ